MCVSTGCQASLRAEDGNPKKISILILMGFQRRTFSSFQLYFDRLFRIVQSWPCILLAQHVRRLTLRAFAIPTRWILLDWFCVLWVPQVVAPEHFVSYLRCPTPLPRAKPHLFGSAKKSIPAANSHSHTILYIIYIDDWMTGWIDRCMDGCIDRWTDGSIDGWMGGWMDGG